MKKIFVAYADGNMSYSLRRLGKQAYKLNIFDEIILWTPNDLPEYIRTSSLMRYSYGGGYWAWKPCIIYETLQRYEEGTIVCYVDAGCTLNKGVEWILWFELMREYETLLFKYRDEMLCWEKFGSISTKIKHWTKKKAILFYDKLNNGTEWRELNKIWGGCLFVKGRNNQFIKNWLDIILNNPDVIYDPTGDERKDQYPFFALHKHDQSLLTALSWKYRQECLVLPELSETQGSDVAIYASRIRAKSLWNYIWLKILSIGRCLIGDYYFERIKKIIK